MHQPPKYPPFALSVHMHYHDSQPRPPPTPAALVRAALALARQRGSLQCYDCVALTTSAMPLPQITPVKPARH